MNDLQLVFSCLKERCHGKQFLLTVFFVTPDLRNDWLHWLHLEPLVPLFLGFSPTSPIALPQFVLDVTAPHPSHAPQGSVLGPLLFMAYIFPIAGIAHLHNIDKQQYADDTQLFISLSPSDYMPNLDSLMTPLTPCIFGSVQMAWP